MSRQTLIPLLQWRQGAGQSWISQTHQTMNSMVPNCPPFTSRKPLIFWINLLSAGSIAMLWVLGVSTIKPVQANAPEQQARQLEPSQVSQPKDLGESRKQVSQPITKTETSHRNTLASRPENSVVAVAPVENPTSKAQVVQQPTLADGGQEDELSQQLSQEIATAQSVQPLAVSPIIVLSSSTRQAKEASVTPVSPLVSVGVSTGNGTTSNLGKPTVSSVLIATVGNAGLSSEALTPASQTGPNHSNPTLGQQFYLSQTPLPVPPTPIPVGSGGSSSTLGQLPSFPSTQSPLPVTASPMPGGTGGYNSMYGQSSYYPQSPQPFPGQATAYPGVSNGYNPAMGQVMAYPGVSNGYNPAMGQVMAYPAGFNGYNPAMGQVMAYPAGFNGYNPAMGQVMAYPAGFNGYNPAMGQSPYMPQTVILVPVPTTPSPMGFNGYNPAMGQSPYMPQTVILVPVPGTPSPMGFNGYNPAMGQSPYMPQAQPPLPVSPNLIPVGSSIYNPAIGQSPYLPQAPAPLPAPLAPNSVGFNSPGVGQSSYLPQTPAPLPPTLPPNSVGFSSYNPGVGQSSYLPQTPAPLPPPLAPNSAGFSSYNPGLGQSPNVQQTAPLPQNPVVPNNYNPTLGQSPNVQQTPPPLPSIPNPNVTPPAPTSATELGQASPGQQSSFLRSTALTPPSVQLQGTYITQGDQSAARARLGALYPLNSRTLLGATLDLTSEENSFADSPNQGLNINELYLATAPFDNLPNLRFVVGQLDLTSYFDRNSFAKDAATHFFNSVFQTNPALSATGIGSRPGFLVNWTLTDNIEAKAAAFSSSRSIGDFALDGFAGEVGVRYGNAIVRGTYATDRDAGSDDGFREIFSIPRDGGDPGLESADREEAYGLNAEVFIPELKMGVFGRYGRYVNREIREGGNTYSIGVNFLDVFKQDDRLGLAYGRALSNDELRQDADDDVPDVLELFYDFRFLPNLRLGLTLQQRNGFSDTYAGFRVKTEFDVTPRGRLAP